MAAVRFQCPLCSKFFQAEATPTVQTARCPACRGLVQLPPVAAPAAAPAGVIPPPVTRSVPVDPLDLVEGYHVRDYDLEPPARPGAAPKRYIAVVCRVCSTRLHFSSEQAGQKIDCPDCGTSLVIPLERGK